MPPIIMLVAMLASATLVIFGLRSGGQRRRGILFLTGYGILLVEGDLDVKGTLDWEGVVMVNKKEDLDIDLGGNVLSVDYAYRTTDPFDGIQVITASVTL